MSEKEVLRVLEMRVFETASRLDCSYPDWEDGVNVIRLNIAHPADCIGGQCARGVRRKEQAYLVFLEELGHSSANAYLLGVDVDMDMSLAMSRKEQFKALTGFWLVEINHRIRRKEEAKRVLRKQAVELAERKLAARFGRPLLEEEVFA